MGQSPKSLEAKPSDDWEAGFLLLFQIGMQAAGLFCRISAAISSDFVIVRIYKKFASFFRPKALQQMDQAMWILFVHLVTRALHNDQAAVFHRFVKPFCALHIRFIAFTAQNKGGAEKLFR